MSIRAIAGLAVALAGVAPATAAAAPAGQPGADQIAAQVNRVAPPVPDAERVTAAPSAPDGGKLTARGEAGLALTIPEDDAGTVGLSRPDEAGSLSVGLPTAGAPSDAVVAQDGTVTYADGVQATDVAVTPFDSGLRVQTVLKDASAPNEFAFPVAVPEGGQMELIEDGGVLVTDSEGLPQGGFAAPWAKDAEDRDVPTHYEIRGNTVVQVVEHSAASAYPIVADPWLFKNLIKRAKWKHEPGKGSTLRVTPTSWARKFPGSGLVGQAGWRELYSKYRNRGLNRNLASMRNQFICHQAIVALRSPRKPTWNIDDWRPNVGYVRTVWAKCNP